jgi:hypothetical protein
VFTKLLSLLRKPLDNNEYRVLLVIGVSGVFLMATAGFIAIPARRWEAALIFGVLAVPGSLVGAVMCILLDRWRGRAMGAQPVATLCSENSWL